MRRRFGGRVLPAAAFFIAAAIWQAGCGDDTVVPPAPPANRAPTATGAIPAQTATP